MFGAYSAPNSSDNALQTQSEAGSSYEGQLVSHIMEYINNLWRVDPVNFAATLNTICMRAPALMQRLMDHELASNAAVEERFAGQGATSAAPSSSSAADQQSGFTALQHPHELEVGSCVLVWRWCHLSIFLLQSWLSG
jgi:hypothetical protein